MEDIDRTSTADEFDADAILADLLECCGETVRAFAEYDAKTYNVLYFDQRLVDEIETEAELQAFADRIHEDYRLDFTEKRMYEDVYSELGEVRAFSVFFRQSAIIRFVGEREGIYVSLDRDAPFNEAIESVYENLAESS
ncbi:DUF7522 family protein [Natrinema marinum]|uniref:DUF7522 family protein n=1 Tax=Natrinema marinum TaxID=2961598 RepID=UPI0020C8466B|nr:hypothetical protein [Natrinema marinum]